MSEEVKHIEEEVKEPSSFRLIATLGVAGFLSGLILVSVYLITKPIIAKNKAEALRSAIFEVLSNTSSFKTLVPDGDGLREAAEKEEVGEDVIYLGYNAQGKVTGFAIAGGEPGYQDIISAIYGFDAGQEMVIGFKVLDSKETPGLGDKIFKDADFQTNFSALKVSPEIEAVKKGEKKTENQVEAISGATISSKAIVRLLNNSMAQWKPRIENYLAQQNTQKP
jgi:electron transport complex protein RnfG